MMKQMRNSPTLEFLKQASLKRVEEKKRLCSVAHNWSSLLSNSFYFKIE